MYLRLDLGYKCKQCIRRSATLHRELEVLIYKKSTEIHIWNNVEKKHNFEYQHVSKFQKRRQRFLWTGKHYFQTFNWLIIPHRITRNDLKTVYLIRNFKLDGENLRPSLWAQFQLNISNNLIFITETKTSISI